MRMLAYVLSEKSTNGRINKIYKNMAKNFDEIIEKIEKLSALELSELVKALGGKIRRFRRNASGLPLRQTVLRRLAGRKNFF